MSERLATLAYVGDLLSIATGRESTGVEVIELRPGRAGIGPCTRFGLRRGMSATQWYATGCRLEASDPARAAAAYERAIAGCPGLADAHNNLGHLLHDQGALALAESSYRLAICADAANAL